MKATGILSLLLLLGTLLPAQAETSQLVELTVPDTPALRARLVRAGFDVLPAQAAHPGRLRLILAPGESPRLRALNLGHRLVAEGKPLAQALGGPEALDPLYFTPAEIKTLLENLAKNHPGLVRFYDLNAYTGTALTHEGRRIYAIKISDNPGVDEDEPNICMVGQHHAREVNSSVMVTETITAILKNYPGDPAVKRMVEEFELWFVPMANPDGTNWVFTKDNWWRKNRRDNGGGQYGVDPNRNYPFRWRQCGYSTNPGSSTYCGPSAGSEPCVQTVMALSDKRHFTRLLDFHSYGREVLFTYSPCSLSIPAARKNLLDRVILELRTAASYQTRTPSASGEDQEWQIARRGTLAFLVEVMTSFQPSYASAVTEAQTRIWPLFRKFMDQGVPLSGHVRDLRGRPLAAEIAVQGVTYSYGEKVTSGGPWGRYALWLDDGTYTVTFSAPGCRPATIKVGLKAAAPLVRDIVLEPLPAKLALAGSGRIGTKVPFTLTAVNDAGLPYYIGTALGTSPGQQVGSRTFPLNGDALFLAALITPGLFQGSLGWLDPAGQGRMTFPIPALPLLVGNTFWFAGFTADYSYPFGVKSLSNPVSLKFIP